MFNLVLEGEANPVVDTLTTALADTTSNIGPVAAVGLGIGGTILAFTIGWRLIKRFAK